MSLTIKGYGDFSSYGLSAIVRQGNDYFRIAYVSGTNLVNGNGITVTKQDITDFSTAYGESITPMNNHFYVGRRRQSGNLYYKVNTNNTAKRVYLSASTYCEPLLSDGSSDSRNYYNTDFVFDIDSDTTLYIATEESLLPEIKDTTPITVTTGTLTNCSASTSPGSPVQGDTVTVTWTATNGYEFTTTPTVTTNASTLTATVSSDKTSATLTISDTANVTSIKIDDVTATEKIVTTPITVTTGTLTNCSASTSPTSPVQGDTVTVTWTVTNGYEFTTAPTVTTNASTLTATVSSDKTSATLTISDTANVTSIKIDDVTASEKIDVVACNVSNLSATRTYYIVYRTSANSQWYVAKTLQSSNSYTLDASDFIHNPYQGIINIASTVQNTIWYRIDNDTTGAISSQPTVHITIDGNDYYRTGIGYDVTSKHTYEFGSNESEFENKITFEDGDLQNCTYKIKNGNGETLNKNNILRGDTFTIRWYWSYDLLEFKTLPTITVTKSDESTETLTANAFYGYGSHDVYLKISDSKDIVLITVNGKATIKTEYSTSNFLTIYWTDSDIMDELSKKRFVEQTGLDNTIELTDLAQYITSFKKIWVSNTDSTKCTKFQEYTSYNNNFVINGTTKQHIVLGNTDTKVESPVVLIDTYTLFSDATYIRGQNNNTNDYTCDVTILLPFCGTFSLSADKVVNKYCQVEYKISLVNGECVAYLYSSDEYYYDDNNNFDVDDWNKNRSLVDTFTGKCAIDLPYRIDTNYRTNYTLDENTLYGTTPIITLTYKENYNANHSALINDNRYCQLNTLTGLNYIDDVIIDNSNITDDEKDMIIDKLQNGVIF